MKYILIFLTTSVFLFSDTLQWSSDYNQTFYSAKQEAKPVLMMYHASWCPECAYMKEVIFKDPKLSAYMKKHYKLLAFDIQKDKKRLPKGYTYKGVPTFYVISRQQKLLGKIEGATKAKSFLQRLESIK